MTTRSGYRFAVSIGVVVVIAASSAPRLGATTFVGVADDRLADQAEVIASVEVVSSRVVASGGRIQTHVITRPVEFIKGWASGPELLVRVPGGASSEDGRAVWIPGAPRFRAGDRALLFLRRSGDGSFRILHLLLGAFFEESSTRGPVLVRALGEAREITAPGERSSPLSRVRHRGLFEAWLRDRVEGFERPADYMLERPPAARAAWRQEFTLLSSEDRFRWFEFDGGGEVQWLAHRRGQKGLKGGGVKIVRRALAAWNGGRTATSVSFTYAGRTKAKTGFSARDGLNTILFHDANDLVADDFDCDSGGVLAVGGLSWAVRSGKRWKGREYLENVEGEVVVNDGVECLFKVYPSVALQVLTHELGHTLGLGHSCGPSATERFPACRSSRLLRDATMRAVLHWPGRGDRLAADDIAATRFLYDPDYVAAPCHLPPGDKRFCKACGPCGEGQGSCRRDRQCAAGLACRKGVGADFGLEPDTNVCAPPD